MAQPRILSSVEIEFQGQSQARELIERAGFSIEVRHPTRLARRGNALQAKRLRRLLAGGENLNATTMDPDRTTQDHRPQRRRLRQG